MGSDTMGRLILVKCNCGFLCDTYRFGINWSYSDVVKHQTALVRSGKYGDLWKRLLEDDPELLVDVEIHLYQCPKCLQLISEYRMDLYKSKKNCCYYVPTDEERVYHYKHLCPDCEKLMKRIPFSQKNFRVGEDNSEELVNCPRCGEIVIAEFCGFTD